MGESSRGYEADQIRVFDGSEDDDAEGSRLPVLIVIALVVLASFAGVVWLAYQKGVASGRSEPRVVVADTDNSSSSAATGGNPTEYKGLKIYEQPAPNDAEQSPAPAQKAAPVDSAPKAQTATASPPLRPVTEPTDNSVTAQAVTPTAPPPPATAKPAIQKKVAALAPTKPVTTKPVTTTQTDASAPPRTLEPAVTAPPAHAATGGAYLLQIGSYKSEGEENSAWANDKKKFGGVLADYSPDVKQVDLGEKGTWYRLRIASFADKSSANDVCDKLKAAGGSCILAK